MKLNRKRISVCVLCAITLTGCNRDIVTTNTLQQSNKVEEAIKEQMEPTSTPTETPSPTPTSKEIEESTEVDFWKLPTPDYDLTYMNADMVYSTVSQMMIDPDSFVGKIVKVTGNFWAYKDDDEEEYHIVCIIQDALACCAQGLEFVWDDGSHIYPDDYPELRTIITVQGTFDYHLEGHILYCTLTEATMAPGIH